eukprot:1156224-Pelagomonas_calceolata.AAC.6
MGEGQNIAAARAAQLGGKSAWFVMSPGRADAVLHNRIEQCTKAWQQRELQQRPVETTQKRQ